MKRKVEIAAIEWDDFMLQEQLKSLIYTDHSLRGDPNKDKLIDESKFRNLMHLKINTTIKFFVGITVKGRKFIIDAEYFDAKNIFSHQFIQNLKHIPNVVQDLSKPTKKVLRRQIFENSVEQKVHQIKKSLARMVKNTVDGRIQKNMFLLEIGWISNDFEFREP